MPKSSLKASFEAIDVQRSSQLFNELSAHLKNYQEHSKPTKDDFAQLAKRIAESVKNHSGININLKQDPSNIPNAYVMIPQIDRNHPLLIEFYREVTDNRDGLKAIHKNGGVFEGSIDRSSAKVSGGFAKFPVRMGITKGLFDPTFSAQEIAGIILHELGHVFTYFEYLGTNITTNYVLQHVSRTLLGTREIKRKYQIIKEGSDALGIEVQDPEALTRTDNETTIQAVLLREVVAKQYSEMNSKTYDMTAWEMLSDQFSTRHGAGRSLVTALDKMYRTYGAAEYRNTKDYLLIESFKALLFIVSIPLTFLLVPFLLLVVIDPSEDLYDKPKSRIARIRRDMVDALKDRNTDKSYQKQLVEDIETIDKILSEMQERRTFLEMFWTSVYPKGRHNYRQLRFQQDLEMLANNDLFVKASKLKSLSL